MAIGTLTIKLHIPQSSSLKAKRQILKSLKDKLHNRFNVSVAETDSHDKWQLATLVVATVSNDKRLVDATLNNILNFIDEFKETTIVDHDLELF